MGDRCPPHMGDTSPAVACDEPSTTTEDWDAAESRAIGSFIAAGVFGAATVATFFLWPANQEAGSPPAATVAIGPWSYEGGRGAQVRVGF